LSYNEEKAVLETAFEDGKAEGKAEASQEIAKTLKAQNVPTAIIATATGLTPAEIEAFD
jgi:predicted transposase/invertase (TIGR01784 family)